MPDPCMSHSVSALVSWRVLRFGTLRAVLLFQDDLTRMFFACRPYAEKYAADQDAFFADYAKAHAKLSELGVDWDPEPMPVSI